MGSFSPIDCELYDRLEIACMYRYELEINLVKGGPLRGCATDTTARQGREFLIVTTPTSKHEVPMDQLAHIAVLTPNAKFKQLHFKPQS